MLTSLTMDQLKQTLTDYIELTPIQWIQAHNIKPPLLLHIMLVDLLTEWRVDGQLLYHFPDLVQCQIHSLDDLIDAIIIRQLNPDQLKLAKQLIAADLTIQSRNQLVELDWISLLNQVQWSTVQSVHRNLLIIDYDQNKKMKLMYPNNIDLTPILDQLCQQLNTDYMLKRLTWSVLQTNKLDNHSKLINLSPNQLDSELRLAIDSALLRKMYSLNRNKVKMIDQYSSQILQLLHKHQFDVKQITNQLGRNHVLSELRWN